MVKPTRLGEPHTVTFVTADQYWANFETAYIAKNVEGFEPLTPGENAEPITLPGPEGQRVIVVADARSIMPATVSAHDAFSFLAPNASYSMDGTENYVNSGFIWPEGMTLQDFPR